MFSEKFAVFFMLGGLLLASGAIGATEQDADGKNGAKHGWIVELYTPDSPAADLPECLTARPAADLATRHFVKVYYRHSRHTLSTIAELPDTLQPKLNDQVEFLPENCSSGKFSRITRIFPSAS